MLIRGKYYRFVGETVFFEDRFEEIDARELVLGSVFDPNHVRYNDHFLIEHFVNPKEIFEDDFHDSGAENLYNFDPIGLKAKFDDTAIIVLRVIIDPKDDFIGIGPRQRNLLQFSCLYLFFKVKGVDYKICEWN